jgi:hypothetical protein
MTVANASAQAVRLLLLAEYCLSISKVWMERVEAGLGWFCLICYATATWSLTSSSLTCREAEFLHVKLIQEDWRNKSSEQEPSCLKEMPCKYNCDRASTTKLFMSKILVQLMKDLSSPTMRLPAKPS